MSTGHPGTTTTTDAARIKELERENGKLRRANETLLAASSFFARELVLAMTARSSDSSRPTSRTLSGTTPGAPGVRLAATRWKRAVAGDDLRPRGTTRTVETLEKAHRIHADQADDSRIVGSLRAVGDSGVVRLEAGFKADGDTSGRA